MKNQQSRLCQQFGSKNFSFQFWLLLFVSCTRSMTLSRHQETEHYLGSQQNWPQDFKLVKWIWFALQPGRQLIAAARLCYEIEPQWFIRGDLAWLLVDNISVWASVSASAWSNPFVWTRVDTVVFPSLFSFCSVSFHFISFRFIAPNRNQNSPFLLLSLVSWSSSNSNNKLNDPARIVARYVEFILALCERYQVKPMGKRESYWNLGHTYAHIDSQCA